MGSLVMLIMMLFTFVSHFSGIEPVVYTKSESKSAIFIVVLLIVIIL